MTQYTYFEFFIFLGSVFLLYIASPFFSFQKLKDNIADFLFNEKEIKIEAGQTWWRIISIHCPVDTLRILSVEGDKITIEENGKTSTVYSGYLNSFRCLEMK